MRERKLFLQILQTHGCRHIILRPCISGQSTHSLTLIQVITKREILLTHRRNKADTKCTHALFQPAPSHSTHPAQGPQCAWGVQSCPAPCLCCTEFPANIKTRVIWCMHDSTGEPELTQQDSDYTACPLWQFLTSQLL